MVQALANWILSLADTLVDGDGRKGLLRIYSDRTKVRGLCSISLDRIIEHTQASRADVVSAIGSLMPTAGSGNSIHVIVTTDERRVTDARDKRIAILNARDNQRAQLFDYLLAANKVVSYNLPTFIAPEGNETTVN